MKILRTPETHLALIIIGLAIFMAAIFMALGPGALAQTHAPKLDALLADAAPATYSVIDGQALLIELGTIVEYLRIGYEQAYIGMPVDAAIVVGAAITRLEEFDTANADALARLEGFATDNRRDAVGWAASGVLRHVRADRVKLLIRARQLQDILALPFEEQRAALDTWRDSALSE